MGNGRIQGQQEAHDFLAEHDIRKNLNDLRNWKKKGQGKKAPSQLLTRVQHEATLAFGRRQSREINQLFES